VRFEKVNRALQRQTETHCVDLHPRVVSLIGGSKCQLTAHSPSPFGALPFTPWSLQKSLLLCPLADALRWDKCHRLWSKGLD
jgi:hypothetical protein